MKTKIKHRCRRSYSLAPCGRGRDEVSGEGLPFAGKYFSYVSHEQCHSGLDPESRLSRRDCGSVAAMTALGKCSKGQSLIEAALIAPLIVFFLFTIIWFGSVMLTWQQLISAARLGTDLLAYTPMSKSAVEREITNYLCHKENIGRILDPEKLEFEIKPKDAVPMDFTLSYDNISSSDFWALIDKLKDISPIAEMSSIEVRYKYKVPRVIKLASGQEEFWLKARSEVLTGDGSAKSKKRQS